jgi:long-chain acyl-CoA synthetase
MLNVSARINEAAARFPDRPAIELVHADCVETTPYAALADAAARFATWLGATGIASGDRVAILADNDARWVAAYLGILRIGAVVVPFDTAYKPAQVRTILESSGARLLLTSLRYLETARAVVAGGATPRVVLLSGSAAGVGDGEAIWSAGPTTNVVEVTADAAAVILYTSGTTADPKGVVLTHANLDAERLAVFAVVDAGEQDAVLGVLPLFHALAQMANLLLPLTVGARVVFLETVSSSSLLKALEERGITILACVPQFFYLIHQRVIAEVARAGMVSRTLFRLLLRLNTWLRCHTTWNPGIRWFGRVHRVLGSKMRILVTGGSKFDPSVGRDLYGLGFTVLNAYGLTETSGGATMTRPKDRFTTSVGQPLPGVEIQIAPDSKPAEARDGDDHDGEILIRGPIVMREYFNRPDATREALRDGWLQTGDLGRLDAEGRLYITGRKKEIIVLSSGKNLYPEEIEAHYRQSPFIKELCVLGLSRAGEPSAERLHAVVVADQEALAARGIVNLGELLRFEIENLSVQLPAHKRILGYDIWLDALPRTTTGKIKRHEIERRVHEHATASAADAETPLTDSERSWLAEPEHAAALAAIAARGHRAHLRPDANLELDLGLDSMERVELLTTLEQRQGTRVPADVRAAIFTLRQLVDAVRAAPTVDKSADTASARDALPWETILATPTDPALVHDLRRPRRIRALCAPVAITLLGVALRTLVRFRTTGRHHLPPSGPFLLCPNHQSFLDGLFLAAALPVRTVRQLFVVGDAALFDTPVMRPLARAINVVPVDADANLVTAMRAGAAGLRLRKVLLLFPEGERTIDGELKRFRKGAAILASHVGAPIVPVAIDGLYELWPRSRAFNWRGLLPWRRSAVSIAFGAPVMVGRDAYAEDTAALQAAVEGLIADLRRTSRVSR